MAADFHFLASCQEETGRQKQPAFFNSCNISESASVGRSHNGCHEIEPATRKEDCHETD